LNRGSRSLNLVVDAWERGDRCREVSDLVGVCRGIGLQMLVNPLLVSHGSCEAIRGGLVCGEYFITFGGARQLLIINSVLASKLAI